MSGAWLKFLFLWSKKHFLYTISCARHELGFIIMEETQKEVKKNGLGVAGFVVALVGFLLTLVPVIRIVGAIICLIGLILAVIAVFKKPRGLAIVGIILAIAGCVIYYIKWAQFAHAVAEAAAPYMN